jgi:8-oxo-dGTP diphosphatase
MSKLVNLVNNSDVEVSRYPYQFVGCLILTSNHKILLQQRGQDWDTYPGFLCEFGGKIENQEQPAQAVIREIKEELGAQVNETELISLGAISDPMLNDMELVYVYFWHDKLGSITGCYEGEARYFEDSTTILTCPQITNGLRWLLAECKERGLIK